MLKKQFLVIQCVAGIAVLAVLGLASSYVGALIIVFTMGIAGALGELAGNLGILIAAIGLFIYGSTRHDRMGFALSPFAFLGLWVCVSVGSRLLLAVTTASFVPSMNVSLPLSRISTLVVSDQLFPNTILANGVIERLVEINYQDKEQTKISTITETRLARGENCTKEDHAISGDLHKAGRVDECYKNTKISEPPDGLYIAGPKENMSSAHCCLELSAVVLEAGQKKTVLLWRQGQSRVPAYLPLLRMESRAYVTRPSSIWESPSGPFHFVAYGAPDLRAEVMASAIFGADSLMAPKLKDLPQFELSKRAADLLASWQKEDVNSAAGIVSSLFAKGYVDDNSIKVAARAALLAHPARESLNLRLFLKALTPEQKEVLYKEILDVFAKPMKCDWCNLRLPLLDPNYVSQTAVQYFKQNENLYQWQYNGLVRLADIQHYSNFEKKRARRRQILETVTQSPQSSMGLKMLAMVYEAGPALLDEEIIVFAGIVDRIPDEQFLALARTSILPPAVLAELNSKHNSTIEPTLFIKSESWTKFWKAMLARAETIPDVGKRQKAEKRIKHNLAKGPIEQE